ncbi:unnamed protein product, partial [Rhizoctonia solani]
TSGTRPWELEFKDRGIVMEEWKAEATPKLNDTEPSPPKAEPWTPPLLIDQYTTPLIQIANEIESVPSISSLVECLTGVFRAIELTRVNKEQWKLLRGRCIMVLRIAANEVLNNGGESYPGLDEATRLLEEKLNEIQERAQYYNRMDKVLGFLQHKTISDEIRTLFGGLDTCLARFSYAEDVAQEQWIWEFQVVQERESSDLEHLGHELEKMNMGADVTSEDALKQIIKDKSSILQEQPTTEHAYLNAQRLVRTILSITKLQLPPMLLTGRQCTVHKNIPLKIGNHCNVYPALFLGGEKVAKKIFRLGSSENNYIEQYATRFLRIAHSWSELRKSDYILPFYGVGIGAFEGSYTHPGMYMVTPLMNNRDAMTYLEQYRNRSGMKKHILQIITDAAMGLQYMHNLHPPFVHSWMRGKNVLITDSGGAVLGGFGITMASGELGMRAAMMRRGGDTSPRRWQAPEITSNTNVSRSKTPGDVWGWRVDVPFWAMTTLEIISGSIPYYMHQRTMAAVMKVHEARPQRQDYPGMNDYGYRPDEMWALLERCWDMEPANRPTMDEIVAELEGIARMPEWVP